MAIGRLQVAPTIHDCAGYQILSPVRSGVTDSPGSCGALESLEGQGTGQQGVMVGSSVRPGLYLGREIRVLGRSVTSAATNQMRDLGDRFVTGGIRKENSPEYEENKGQKKTKNANELLFSPA